MGWERFVVLLFGRHSFEKTSKSADCTRTASSHFVFISVAYRSRFVQHQRCSADTDQLHVHIAAAVRSWKIYKSVN